MDYGIGIIGTGLIAEFHAHAIAVVKGARLVSVLSRSEERAMEFSRKFGCKGYSSQKEFFSDQKLDIVSICTPSGAHMEPALKAIEARKHLVIEKPLEITLKRCDAIIEAAEKQGVLVTGIFQSRYYEGSQLLKKAIDSNRFGKLVLGDAYVKWHRNQEYYDKGGWKGTKRYDGGGALMNQSIHAIDLLQWFMGTVDSVQAFKGIMGHERIEVEDTAVAALEFSNGALGVVEGSTAVFPGFLKRIEISGTEGTAILEEENLKVWKFSRESAEDDEIRHRYNQQTKSGGGAADPGAISMEGHIKQFGQFIGSLRERKPLLIDAKEARKSVAIILAIYRSADKGRKIKMSHFA
ncbi:MAG: Gfo/Idh/MocA family oxidoreductase [Spirochaetota bacterium]|nr:MAG: Gfo/Idh/MocA family oxidoreductase [Spirochaetota bacterium]